MNLRVDLILESEQRSASMLNLKTVRRLTFIVIPLALGLILAFTLLGTMRLSIRVADLETQWRILEPQKEAALARSRQIARHSAILAALESWPETKLTLHNQLAAIMAMTPATIQITSFNYRPSAQSKMRARESMLELNGRSRGSSGDESEKMIELLEELFKTTEPFATIVQSVTMSGRGDSSKDALPTDRNFDITCVYHPKPFKP